MTNMSVELMWECEGGFNKYGLHKNMTLAIMGKIQE
jgi:hypothetical protein